MKVIIFIAALATCYALTIPPTAPTETPAIETSNSNSTVHHHHHGSNHSSHNETNLELDRMLRDPEHHEHPANCTHSHDEHTVASNHSDEHHAHPENATEIKVPISPEGLAHEATISEEDELLIERLISDSTASSGNLTQTTNVTMSTSKVTREAERAIEIVGEITPEVKKLINHTETLLKPTPSAEKNVTEIVTDKTPVLTREISHSEKPSLFKNETLTPITPTPIHENVNLTKKESEAILEIVKDVVRSISTTSAPIHSGSENKSSEIPLIPKLEASLSTEKPVGKNDSKIRDRRSFRTTVTEVRESEDSYGSYAPAPVRSALKFAVRTKPVLASSSGYASSIREDPESSDYDYDSEIKESPSPASPPRYGSSVREASVVRSSAYGSSVSSAPVVQSSGYGPSAPVVPAGRPSRPSRTTTAPIVQSYGYETEASTAAPKIQSSNYETSAPTIRGRRPSAYAVQTTAAPTSGYETPTSSEAPKIRSSNYGSAIRTLPIVRSSKYAPKITPTTTTTKPSGYEGVAIRSFGFGAAPRRIEGDSPFRKIEEDSPFRRRIEGDSPFRQSAPEFELEEDAQVPKGSYSTGPISTPNNRAKYASKVPALRSSYGSAVRETEVETEFKSGGYSSDVSELKVSEDIPVIRSGYAAAVPVRESIVEIRGQERYKR